MTMARITTPANNTAHTTKAIMSFFFVSFCSVLFVGITRFFGCSLVVISVVLDVVLVVVVVVVVASGVVVVVVEENSCIVVFVFVVVVV